MYSRGLKMDKIAHCLFEQSGTFKNEFKKLGFKAFDYDILNDFGATDFKIYLFNEIDQAYKGKKSLFDGFSKDDIIMAFFPCTRFENQIQLSFRGEQKQDKSLSDAEKLQRGIVLHGELHNYYVLFSKLCIVAIQRKLKLIIENPYSSAHYLTRYFSLKPKVIDTDRTLRGDNFKKPTQYWFINCEPKFNIILEPLNIVKYKTITSCSNQVERSMINPQYANRFIREFIL